MTLWIDTTHGGDASAPAVKQILDSRCAAYGMATLYLAEIARETVPD